MSLTPMDRAGAADLVIAMLDQEGEFRFQYEGDPAELCAGLAWLTVLMACTACAVGQGLERVEDVDRAMVRQSLLAVRQALEVEAILTAVDLEN